MAEITYYVALPFADSEEGPVGLEAVVGWSMSASLSRDLALDALLMAVWRRKQAGDRTFGSGQSIPAATTSVAFVDLITWSRA